MHRLAIGLGENRDARDPHLPQRADHPNGDFALTPDGRVDANAEPKLTFAGIGVYRPALLAGWFDTVPDDSGAHLTPPRFKLAPVLKAAMRRGLVDGVRHRGAWTDVGTPERLDALRRQSRM